MVNAVDIDLLYTQIHLVQSTGVSNLVYDLNGDGVVDQSDMDYLITTILETRYGDANLDGHVDYADFQVVMDNWMLYGKGWAGGDFNGDGVTDYGDFQILLDNWSPA